MGILFNSTYLRKQVDVAYRPSRIRARRAELGMTQGELAKRVGSTQKQVSLWESGTKPSYQMLAKLAEVLACSADYLLGLTSLPDAHVRENDLSPEEHALIVAIRAGRSIDEIDALILRASEAEAAKRRKTNGKRHS